jgi:hypothetical protein
MMPSRGMGAVSPKKIPKARMVVKRDGPSPVKILRKGGRVCRSK